MGDSNRHDFKIPDGSAALALGEGLYEEYLQNPQRLAKVQANAISYSWDRLIQKFSFHALNGTQHPSSSPDVSDADRILRWMAREPRVRRRMLARKLVECVQTTPAHMRRTTVSLPSHAGDPTYVFQLLPWNARASDEENRVVRMEALRCACMIARLKYPDATDVVGISTESGADVQDRSEDALYLDFRGWNDEMAKEAEDLRASLGFLERGKESRGTEYEYPPLLGTKAAPALKAGRNSPCPCGSGLKFKRCHGKR
jgi:hypothetical protein